MAKTSAKIRQSTSVDDLAASIEKSLSFDSPQSMEAEKPVDDAQSMQSPGNVIFISGKGKRIPNEIWAKIEVGYRAGLNATELATAHAVAPATVRNRAKTMGWSRDLQRRIREETTAKLAADGLAAGASADDIVDAASDAGAVVIQRHRRTTARLGTIIELYATRLETALTAAPGETKDAALQALGARESIADAILKTANAISRLLPQERQANGLTGSTDPATPYEEQVAAFMKVAEQARDAA